MPRECKLVDQFGVIPVFPLTPDKGQTAINHNHVNYTFMTSTFLYSRVSYRS